MCIPQYQASVFAGGVAGGVPPSRGREADPKLEKSGMKCESKLHIFFFFGGRMRRMADVTFHAWGKTYDALLCAASEAMLGTMVENPAAIEFAARKKIGAAGVNEEKLLYSLLEEFLFQKNNEKILLRLEEGGTVQKRGSLLYYEGMAAGEFINTKRHNIIADAKTAAMRVFRLYRKEDSWHCTVVLEI